MLKNVYNESSQYFKKTSQTTCNLPLKMTQLSTHSQPNPWWNLPAVSRESHRTCHSQTSSRLCPVGWGRICHFGHCRIWGKGFPQAQWWVFRTTVWWGAWGPALVCDDHRVLPQQGSLGGPKQQLKTGIHLKSISFENLQNCHGTTPLSEVWSSCVCKATQDLVLHTILQ